MRLFLAILLSDEMKDALINTQNTWYDAGIRGSYTAEENLKWEREESPYIIALFHDLCKSDERGFVDKNGSLKIVSLDAADKRHGEKSIELIEDHIITMTAEERLCIYFHMGEYGGGDDYRLQMNEWMDKNPNIRYVQMADTIAAKMGI